MRRIAPDQPLPSIDEFARDVLQRPLFAYQREIAQAILDSILDEKGRIFTVMLARQSGKNQLSAVIEAFLLYHAQEGTIVKAAPTFSPQIINSRLRLLSLLDPVRERLWTGHGYIVGLAPTNDKAALRAHAGPRVMFYSAGPVSNVVGATADLLLEIDEAQDVTPQKFDRDFRPMASTSNATTVLYGTAWTDDTLLAHQRALNLAAQEQGGPRTHFEYDWRALAEINANYRAFVEGEIARLGEEHPVIQTQYCLRPLSGAGYLLSPLQRALLQGEHAWEEEPGAPGEGWYIAGMDVAGEERPDPRPGSLLFQHTKRDSTVLTIGRASYNELGLPCLEVVHQQWWTGRPHNEQYAATLALARLWNLRALVIDATGLGAALASQVRDALGEERVSPFIFSRPSKSRLTYQMLSLINAGRLKLYATASAPRAVAEECWQQLRLARYRLPAQEVIDMYVDPAEGHDDFLISLALLGEALNTLHAPPASTLVRPPRLYSQESRF